MARSPGVLVAVLVLSFAGSAALSADDIDLSRLWGRWEANRFDNREFAFFIERLEVEFFHRGEYRVTMIIEEHGRREDVEVTGSYSLQGATLLLSTKDEGLTPAFSVEINGWDLILESLEEKEGQKFKIRLRRKL